MTVKGRYPAQFPPRISPAVRAASIRRFPTRVFCLSPQKGIGGLRGFWAVRTKKGHRQRLWSCRGVKIRQWGRPRNQDTGLSQLVRSQGDHKGS